ncbi:putative membrane protein YqjE [Arthrobacter globiformis]|uniref:phage holin family protein n=1 Tax=Arthrobacter globiformis TaxID=1665 RepID=UPI00278965B8|nr:phage holin family protein [Arthrobacter globiformis]MDQ1058190.1 putative membrane protein YqjE [Arthrobacter globiformis]
MDDPAKSNDAKEQPVAELLTQLSQQTSRLVRDELRLAQAELKEKGRHAGRGAGLFGAAGFLAFFGAAALITTIILALSLLLPAWLSALIVSVVLLIAAGIAALVGKKEVNQVGPPAPEATVKNVKRDINEVKEHRHA